MDDPGGKRSTRKVGRSFDVKLINEFCELASITSIVKYCCNPPSSPGSQLTKMDVID
uniref:Uncharacterized protein n=1 Tax=Tetranychus urticae TaxID=32264 RepID=T1K5E2_TETUR